MSDAMQLTALHWYKTTDSRLILTCHFFKSYFGQSLRISLDSVSYKFLRLQDNFTHRFHRLCNYHSSCSLATLQEGRIPTTSKSGEWRPVYKNVSELKNCRERRHAACRFPHDIVLYRLSILYLPVKIKQFVCLFSKTFTVKNLV